MGFTFFKLKTLLREQQVSHIADLPLIITEASLPALARAFEKAGATFHWNQTTYKWVGHWYDDSPVPRHLFTDNEEYLRVCAMSRAERTTYMQSFLGKCSHAISFPGISYTVGVVKVGDNYQLAWDWATPLKRVMGSIDSWNRNDTTHLCPILHDYIQFAVEDQLNEAGLNPLLLEKIIDAKGDLYMEIEHS